MRLVVRSVIPIAALALLQRPASFAGSAAGAQPTGTASTISVGGYSACALTSTRRLKCWGSNNDGQLGIGDDLTNHPTPVRVPGLGKVKQFSVGDYST